MDNLADNETYKLALGHLKNDQQLNMFIEHFGNLDFKPKGSKIGFKYLVDAIVGQQLSSKAAKSIINKIENFLGPKYHPDQFLNSSEEEIKSLGISGRKLSYIKSLSISIKTKELDLDKLNSFPNEEIIDELTKVKGIGKWTAKMYLIFALGRKDVLPIEDKTIQDQVHKYYNKDKKISEEELFEILDDRWFPFQSLACLYLWKAKDEITVPNNGSSQITGIQEKV